LRAVKGQAITGVRFTAKTPPKNGVAKYAISGILDL